MEKSLQNILDLINADNSLSEEKRAALIAGIKEADKKISIGEFKFERSENLKKTLSVVLEETIAELEQKRKVVEDKNNELEIEASLERVRTVAMGMRTPDDLLGICKVLFEELTALGFADLRNAMVNIVNDEKGSFLNYDFNDGNSSVTQFSHNSHLVIERQVAITRKATDAFIEHILTGSELEDFKAFRVKNGEAPDPKLENITALYYYFYSIGDGSVGMSSFSSLTQEKLDVLKRFRNVFDLAYRRYVDIKQAEEQAWEAQIQLALERVRARAMAMQSSDELTHVADVMREQLGLIGQSELDTVAIHLYSDDSDEYDSWYAVRPSGDISGAIFTGATHFRKDSCEHVRELMKGYESDADEYTLTASGPKQKEWIAVLVQAAPIFKEITQGNFPDTTYFHMNDFSGGSTVMVTYAPPSDESKALQKRFTSVFDLAYRRFVDLKQAEAQAREAQIEAALEKVRSRSLAMHASEELAEVVTVVREKLYELNLVKEGNPVTLVTFIQGSKNVDHWVANNGVVSTRYHVPHIDSPLYNDFLAARERGVDFFTRVTTLEEKNHFWGIAFERSDFKNIQDEAKRIILESEHFDYAVAIEKNSAIFISSFVGQLPSEKENEVLKRFAKVFEQAYIRFLDLQKAEAQAREAQIELSLERVRASAMAMHKTDQLLGAAELLYKELTGLGINSMAITYAIMAGDEKSAAYYSINPVDGKINPVPFDAPHTETEVMRAILAGWKKQETFSKLALDEEATLRHQTYIAGILQPYFIEHNFDYNFSVEAFLAVSPKKAVIYSFNFTQGYIFIIGSEHLTKPQEEMVGRFAKVFEMTYRRFLDLKQAEEQARESKIQLALERVRARTMAMQHSDELSETVFILLQQFKELGENPDQATIGIINEKEKVIEYWVTMYGSQINKVFKFPIDEPVVTHKIYKGWKAHKTSLVIDLSGKDLQTFAKFRESMGGAKFNAKEQRRIINVAFFSKGLINVQSTEERSEESIRLLERFAGVFDGTYTRFLDLKKAEETAREAQIEAALEKVRSRSLAMHQSNELSEVVAVVFEKLHDLLEIAIDGVSIMIPIKGSKDLVEWAAGPDRLYPESFITPYSENLMIDDLMNARDSGADFFSRIFTKDEKDVLWKYAFETGYKDLEEKIKKRILASDTYAYSVAFEKHSAIVVASIAGHIVSEPEKEILKRFSRVFEQAYIRFLDLQRAEAQAREAQIEAALEKVRSRSLAMHHSSELEQVVDSLFDRLVDLGISFDGAGIYLFDKVKRNIQLWVASTHLAAPIRVELPYDKEMANNGITKDLWHAIESGEHIFNKSYSGETKNDYFRYVAKYNESKVPKPVRQLHIERDSWTACFAAEKNSMVGFDSWSGHVIKEEDFQIAVRFARVFEQAYIRFLDLEKAEAQARESQIQLALERVRARTMAMQNSEELHEVIQLIFDQFQQLNFDIDVANFALNYKETVDFDLVIAVPHGKYPMKIRVPYFQHPVFDRFNKAKKEGGLLTDVFTKKEKDSFFKHFFNYVGVPEDTKAAIFGRTGFVRSTALMKNTALTIHNYNGIPYSEAENNTLLRFGQVFEQTYTRFTDLEQAEAQARESQIQLALERVRARTMAMQHSDELAETASVLFQQLHNLGIIPERVFVGTPVEGTRKIDLWGTEQGGTEMNTRFEAEMDATYAFRQLFKARKDKTSEGEVILNGEHLAEHINYVANVMGMPVRRELVQDQRVLYCADFSKGWLVIVTPDIFSREVRNILQRFAAVFDQTYTRFLDLEKAERAARESQIQLALERVRARTMAMQHSEELAETAVVLFQQFYALGVSPDRVFIATFREESSEMECWTTDQEGSRVSNRFVASLAQPSFARMHKAWKSQKQSFVLVQTGKELSDYINYLRDEIGVPFRKDIKIEQRVQNVGFFSKGLVGMTTPDIQTPEMINLIERFAAVFDQTYTRFLDLQKAEAQGREGQIQLGLERVRAKAMAMQTSEELNELIGTVFSELTKLDFVLTRCLIMIFDPETKASRWWMANSEAPAEPMNYLVQNHKNPAYDSYLKAWKERDLKWNYALKGKVKRDWDDFLFVDTELAQLPGPVIEGMKAPEQVLLSASFNNFGCLTLVTLDPLSDEHSDIMLRFAKVFDMSYTRFNDLKQAEAQAREGQIQLGLERVRAAAMAMHDSAGVGDATALVFTELYKLGISTIRCGVCIVDGPAKEIEVWSASQLEGKLSRGIGRLDMTAHPLWMQLLNAWKTQIPSFTYELKGQELADYYHIIRTASGYHAPDNKAMYNPSTDIANEKQYCNCYIFKEGCLFTFTHEPFLPETGQVLEKFAAVFGLTYRRYLDLQRAEAQAREAQIEASLEKVRSKAMAMHNSDDLSSAASQVFTELKKLGITAIRCGVGLFSKESPRSQLYSATISKDSDALALIGWVDMAGHPVLEKIYNGWLNQEDYFPVLNGKELRAFYQKLSPGMNMASIPGAGSDEKQYGHFLYFNEGALNTWADRPYSEPELKILDRFKSIISLTFRRYLDLKKAEAQAREAQIEAALERVRSKTMAMHNSADVGETVILMFNELIKLGVEKIARCGIAILDNNRGMELWTARLNQGEKEDITIGYIDMNIHPMLGMVYDAWKSKQSKFDYILAGDDMINYITAVNNYPGYPIKYDIKAWGTKQYHNDFFFHEGMVFAFTAQPLSIEIAAIFKRFAGVFGQTYRRYLDLQKAEAQAHEAQIETALERVRSRTMAMQRSDELRDVIQVIYEQLHHLKFIIDSANFDLDYRESDDFNLWVAIPGQTYPTKIRIPYTDHPIMNRIVQAKKEVPAVITDCYTFEQKNDWFKYFLQFAPDVSPERKNFLFSSAGFSISTVLMTNVALSVYNYSAIPYTDTENATLMRFGKVFEQTYTRFTDLKQAEAQAREAQIEAALERVRSKAMAMRSSSDLNETANTVFVELRKLGVDLVRCGVGLMDKQSRITTVHATNSAEGGSLEVLGNIDLGIHPVLLGIYTHWARNEDYFPILENESLKTYYEKLAESGIAVPEWKRGEKQYGYFLPFAEGCLYAWSSEQESEATVKTLKRFTSVVGLTYTRYMELQKAELNAKEAVKQASLDRVRAEIASMRKRSDLERITPLIWEELTVLGIPFIRCGVFIMDEGEKLIHTFLSTPDGKAIGAFHVPFNTSGNFEKMVDSWRHKKSYIDHWDDKAFDQFADILLKQGAIKSKAQYLKSLPHGGIHLNFLPFLQGMLYAGNTEPLSEENIDLIQAVAEAFSTAYARYEDFNKLEAAKQQVDNTLTQLKTTQNKLIQSEKMASLGELTAGIAHEIQNPLNFVNNFSEVSAELIDEMDEELEKGDIEEVKAIAADIRDNLQKIRHHGGRADGIVKGMLQHSRASSNVKEPTDINKLADEYLHLAYHGLRAKDKSFNAELIMHFDEKLPKANVVPQDIGRVILNMINNAFYATQQKTKANGTDFKPEVTVTTSAEDSQVIIKVKDNGNGIPASIKDKIMQPFFTTKPTGEGTGLGLSLSYDIVVKGHDGKIDVDTKESEYSEFIVSLPIN